jgi:hypothetical protein
MGSRRAAPRPAWHCSCRSPGGTAAARPLPPAACTALVAHQRPLVRLYLAQHVAAIHHEVVDAQRALRGGRGQAGGLQGGVGWGESGRSGVSWGSEPGHKPPGEPDPTRLVLARLPPVAVQTQTDAGGHRQLLAGGGRGCPAPAATAGGRQQGVGRGRGGGGGPTSLLEEGSAKRHGSLQVVSAQLPCAAPARGAAQGWGRCTVAEGLRPTPSDSSPESPGLLRERSHAHGGTRTRTQQVGPSAALAPWR